MEPKSEDKTAYETFAMQGALDLYTLRKSPAEEEPESGLPPEIAEIFFGADKNEKGKKEK